MKKFNGGLNSILKYYIVTGVKCKKHFEIRLSLPPVQVRKVECWCIYLSDVIVFVGADRCRRTDRSLKLVLVGVSTGAFKRRTYPPVGNCWCWWEMLILLLKPVLIVYGPVQAHLPILSDMPNKLKN